jgi:sugar O-acyltransferase (sialic acid O-acetyltransferase NeuD family)
MKDLLIIGSGGHARTIIDAALRSGRSVLGLLDIDYNNQHEVILGVRVLGGIELLDDFDQKKVSIIIAIGNNSKRKWWFSKLKDKGFNFATIIHPTATLSSHVSVGKGVFINSGAIVNAESIINDGVIINTGVIVEHEVEIKQYAHLAPGVSVGGRSTIGDCSFIGIGTSVADCIKIGKYVVIGAGSTIVKDVKDRLKIVGIGRILS